MTCIKLKIKIKSLAYEAALIRKEERDLMCIVHNADDPKAKYLEFRLKNPRGSALGDDLFFHRTLDVRHEQRATLIAYGFLRGVPYRAIETEGRKGHERPGPNWGRVREMVEKYGRYGYTKTEKAQAWADIVAWRAVPALPREAAPRKRRPSAFPDAVQEAIKSPEKFMELMTGQRPDAPFTCPALLGS
jgi:hypothetical protein